MTRVANKILKFPTTHNQEREDDRKPPKRERYKDNTYFTVDDIEVGTVLTFFGRFDPNTDWLVYKIVAEDKMPSGRFKSRMVQAAEKTLNRIFLKSIDDPTQTRSSYLNSFQCSALWRINRTYKG